MAALITPPADTKNDKVTSVSDFVKIAGDWHRDQEKERGNGGGCLGQLWYGGVNQEFTAQVPGVYRR